MIKILFVCHGNICRSPMAEFVFKDMVRKAGLANEFEIGSAATSAEEIGNPVHYGTRTKLKSLGIPVEERGAVQLKKSDLAYYDYLIGMDESNIRNMVRILGKSALSGQEGKVRRLLDFTEQPRDIADPWYTGNFDRTYEDIREGLSTLLEYLLRRKE